MSISKSDLKSIKKSLIKNKSTKTRKIQINEAKRNVKKYNIENRIKTKTLWNYKVNDLVYIKLDKDKKTLGLIVSDYMYYNFKVEKNNFFVLAENRVIQVDGKHLRKI
tara:strand:- start:712 stop:1035 length:324 start_codon:yes stop_codon:yes gene_type:complete